MAIGDHYELIDWQFCNGVDCFNVYHYERSSGGGNAQDLIDSFKQDVLPAVVAIQSADVTHIQLVANNFDNFADFAIETLLSANVGGEGTDSLPTFCGWTFRYVRSTRGNHNGRKTLVGVAEGDVTDGVAVGGLTSGLNACAAAMAASIGAGVGTYVPRIMRAPNTVKPTFTNARAFFAIAGVVYVNVSSQNSRKR